MKPVVLYGALGLLIVVIITSVVVWSQRDKQVATSSPSPLSSTQTTPTPQSTTSQTKTATDFGQQKKAAHFETSTPSHGSTLASVPINVVIDFNFDLAAPSSISIKNGGKEYGQGETTIDTNKLGLRRAIDPSAPDGTYTVTYKACWPDKSCHDGQFSFAIDRTAASSYTDMTGQKTVTIRMSDIAFKPMDIRISKGTKVTWVNDDTAEHYVNTDSHPAHTYFTGQNSRALAKGAEYSVTFDNAGAFPYHCSAHADSMTGNIIVEA